MAQSNQRLRRAMTVTSDVQDVSHLTDGVTTTFPIPFYFLRETDIIVDKIDAGGGALDSLVLGTDFTVSGAGSESGGAITTTSTIVTGFVLRIARVVPVTQESEYQQNDPFPSKTTEKALDKLTMIDQQHAATIGRALQVPLSDINALTILPKATQRANKALGFDASGDPFMIDLTIGSVVAPVVSNIAMLRLIDWSTTSSGFALGHTLPGDGGGGQYFPDFTDTTTADNNATVLVATDGTRVKLQVLLYVTTGQFGAKRDSTGINSTGTDDTTAIENALQWVCDRNRAYKLIASPGVHRLTRTLRPTAPFTIEGTSPAPKNVGESAIGGGSWFYFDHTGKGVSMINSAGDFKGVHIEQLGTIRNQPALGPGWAPNNNDFDFYSERVDDIFYRDVMLLNPTQGIYVNKTNNGRVDFERVRGQPFRVGIQVDQMYDVMRVNDVHWWSYWHDDPILWAYCRANCDGMRLYRVDSPIVESYFAINCYSGIRVAQSTWGSTTKMQIGNITVDLSKYGIWWDSSVAGASAQIGNMEFQSTTPAIPGSKAIYIQANGAQIEINKLSSILTGTSAVRVEGANNTLRLGEVRAQLYDQDATGTPAIDCTTGNRVFISGWPDIGGAGGSGGRYAENGTISVDDWRSYAASITASSGSFGAVGVVIAKYKQFNNSVYFTFTANITSRGTAAGGMRISLPPPVPAADNFVGSGKERTVGKGGTLDVLGGSSFATMVNYDGSFPAFDGAVLSGCGVYDYVTA
ncbi:hypothetical protein RVY52_002553 [Burkholderia cenocepacia]|nr:hypothetical protein [Burkholderia cenocepacia]